MSLTLRTTTKTSSSILAAVSKLLVYIWETSHACQTVSRVLLSGMLLTQQLQNSMARDLNFSKLKFLKSQETRIPVLLAVRHPKYFFTKGKNTLTQSSSHHKMIKISEKGPNYID